MRLDPLRILLVALALAGLVAVPLLAADADAEPPRASPANDAEVVVIDDFADDERGLPADLLQRRAQIRAELAREDLPAWAGEYFRGDGEGENTTVWLAPSSGVAATWHGCLGLYGADHGPVQEDAEGALALGFAQSASADDAFGRFPASVQPLRWGERRYLMEPERIVDFVNAMHRGWEPRDERHGQFLLARGDESRAVEGLPALPSPWREAIRSTPLEARTLAVELVPRVPPARSPRPSLTAAMDAVEDYCQQDYRVTIDRGRDDGLLPGLELHPAATNDAWETLRLQHVDARSAVGEVTVFGEDCSAPEAAPGRDWLWSTGAYAPGA
jgi:hypothetical protein